MRHTNRFSTAVLGLCLAAASFGAAADDAAGPDLAAIRAQQIELRTEVAEARGIFESMDARKRSELVSRQDELLAMIEGRNAITDLGDRGQVRAFNLLEEINAMVNNAEDEQIVCEFTRKTGSNRKTKQCMTVAQKRELKRDSEDKLRREFQGGLKPPGT